MLNKIITRFTMDAIRKPFCLDTNRRALFARSCLAACTNHCVYVDYIICTMGLVLFKLWLDLIEVVVSEIAPG